MWILRIDEREGRLTDLKSEICDFRFTFFETRVEAMEDQLREAVKLAAERAEVRSAVNAIYAELQRDIDQRKPVCRASGRCCRFEEFGHRLYVTTIELAVFAEEVEKPPQAAGRNERSLPVLRNLGGCCFQIEGLCSVHEIRPFGCRIFFCDETSTEWQNQRYERYHSALKLLHEQLNVRYFYVEWRQALASLGLDRPEVLNRT